MRARSKPCERGTGAPSSDSRKSFVHSVLWHPRAPCELQYRTPAPRWQYCSPGRAAESLPSPIRTAVDLVPLRRLTMSNKFVAGGVLALVGLITIKVLAFIFFATLGFFGLLFKLI